MPYGYVDCNQRFYLGESNADMEMERGERRRKERQKKKKKGGGEIYTQIERLMKINIQEDRQTTDKDKRHKRRQRRRKK